MCLEREQEASSCINPGVYNSCRPWEVSGMEVPKKPMPRDKLLGEGVICFGFAPFKGAAAGSPKPVLNLPPQEAATGRRHASKEEGERHQPGRPALG